MDLHKNTGTGSDTPPPDTQAMTREQVLDTLFYATAEGSSYDFRSDCRENLLFHDGVQRETIRRLEQQAEMLKGCLDENRKHADQLQARLTASEQLAQERVGCMADQSRIIRELSAKKEWTTERPMAEGVYFWRPKLGQSYYVCLCVRFIDGEVHKLSTFDGEWQGPLTPGE